jgi:hypothetical protein
MARIVGTIADSGGRPVTGFLTVKLVTPLVNTAPNPDEVRYSKAIRYKLVNGSFNSVQDENGNTLASGVELLPSNDPVYQFEYHWEKTTLELYLNGNLWTGDYHTEGTNPVLYYTGATNHSNRQQLTPYHRKTLVPLFDPIHSSIPNQTTVEWSTLQHVSVSSTNLNTAAYHIASLVATQYASQISLNLARPRGNWNVASQYQQFDVVYNPADNGTYWYINTTPSVGHPVTDTNYWMKIGQATSGGGSGIQPSDVLLDLEFNETNWSTQNSKAPVASRLYNQLIQYAKLNDAVFARLRAPTRPLGENSTDVATMQALQQALANYNPPPSTTAPNLTNFDAESTQIVNQWSYKRMYNRYFRVTQEAPPGVGGGSGSGLRPFTHIRNNTVFNPAGSQNVVELTSGYAQLRPGKYYICGRAASRGTDGTVHNLIAQDGTILIRGDSIHTGQTGYQLSVVGNTWGWFSGQITLSTTTNVIIQSLFETTGDATDRGRPCNRGGNEVYAVMEGWVI